MNLPQAYTRRFKLGVVKNYGGEQGNYNYYQKGPRSP